MSSESLTEYCLTQNFSPNSKTSLRKAEELLPWQGVIDIGLGLAIAIGAWECQWVRMALPYGVDPLVLLRLIRINLSTTE